MRRGKRTLAGFELSILLISIFAFAFIMSSEVVSAEDSCDPNDPDSPCYNPPAEPNAATTAPALANVLTGGRNNLGNTEVIGSVFTNGRYNGLTPTKMANPKYTGLINRGSSTIRVRDLATGKEYDVGPNGCAGCIIKGDPNYRNFEVVQGRNSNGAPCIPPQPGCSTEGPLRNGSIGATEGTGDLLSNIGDGLLEGLMWGGIGFGAGQLLGPLFDFNEDQTLALSAGLGAGAFAYQIAGSAGLEGLAQLGVGLGVGAIVFILLYKDVTVEIVSFECGLWQAPTGGNDCELCNDDSLPCSEYRCKSLGQNCELVNPGTDQEKCVNINPGDVSPPVITPNTLDLTPGHSYTDVKNSPPGPGFRIINMNSSDGCLKAFTPLEFGVVTNEPAQCKIDFNRTADFDSMISFMGGNNMYLYNHTEVFALPGATAFEGSPFVLDNGGNLNFFIRCQDRNGNYNSAEYNVRFCMDPTPDTTAPKLRATSIVNNGCVAEDVNFANVDFYTDEPADCKWSHTDQSYDNMPNEMDCSMNLYQLNAEKLFTCSANLTGIARDNTDFYVRCKDQPGVEENKRNKNEQSFKFSLHGSGALKMRNTAPNGTVFGGVSPTPIELYTETLFGCDAGKAVCYYSTTGDLDDYILFFDTNKEDGIHTQRQDVTAGDHEYFIKCVDSGGNVAEETINFRVDIDTSAPVVARAYQEDGNLKIVTVRNSQCAYTLDSCDFTFEEGTEMPFANSTVHVAEWKNDETYYIKCRDEFRAEEADCSIVVRPGRNLF